MTLRGGYVFVWTRAFGEESVGKRARRLHEAKAPARKRSRSRQEVA